MAKKKGGAGRVAKAAGAAAGVSAEAPPLREFNKGDLVLAKVKGWPAWPAQVERLETDGKFQGKYYVTYFGPGQQIGWCLPTELADFDAEQKEAAIQRSQKKTADKKFISALNEICALQDERAGITQKDSGDDNEAENEDGGLLEDDAPRDSGLDGQEDDMTKEEDVTSGVKHESFLPQVTLNKQDDSVPFNDANPEEDVEDDAADKDWREKPEYNGGGLDTGRDSDERGPEGAAAEGANSPGDAEGVESEGNGGTRRAFRNALRRINETADKDPEPKREEPESEGQVLTYQYGRKKNRNKNINLDGSAVVNGAGTTGGQAIANESVLPVAETGEAQKKVKPKLGRPSKASLQAKLGVRDGKPNVQASKKSNGGEKDLKLERGNGGIGHGGGGKYAKDPSNNGHDKKGAYMTKKDIYRSSWKEGSESRERKSEDKKDVKRVPPEADRLKKGPKKPQMSSKEEAKKYSGTPKQRDGRVKDELERKVTNGLSGFHGGSKSKGDVKVEAEKSKRKRVVDDEDEEEGEDASMEGERGDAGTSPKTEIDEKHLPLLKRPKMLGGDEKQKHVSVGRSVLDSGNAERDSPRDGKSRERGTSLPPKADKDRMRKAALDGEAALPPSKRRNRAFAAMSACEAEAANASAAELREQAGNGMSVNQGVSNENVNNEGASPLKTATVTPDISESGDGGHKALKGEIGNDNVGGQERIESKKHVPARDAHATDSPSKGSEEASKLAGSKLEGRSKSFKSKSGATSQNPGGHGSPGVTEKRKGHLTGSEGGKLSTSTAGGTETFPLVAKPSFDDSIIKNAVALANEKRNALKKEADSSASMKVLIAAAQAKQRARQYSTGGSGSFGFPDLDKFTGSMVCSPSPSQKRGSSGLASPVPHGQGIVVDVHAGWNAGVDETASMDPGIDTEATIARDTFVGMLETLSRTKDSIGRTTRQAMDCAKHSIAEQIVEIIVLKLENEPSFHRRVDFWFLLDSVTQVAHTQKVAAFLPVVQGSLPRILNAAAPPGGAARENRKQCLKVLNLWLERKVMPESILRHFMTEIESHNDVDKGAGGGGHRRLSRYERGVDDPVRDMDGMLVDEYGSNASLNLPDRFSLIPQLYEDEEEGSEDDDKKVETESVGAINTSRSAEGEEASERHRTVLEDVDGELEMEDVSPTADSEVVASKERERLLGGRYAEDARAIPGQPPLPLGPPPSMPSPPPLPTEPPPSPPPPPQSPPPPSTGLDPPYPRTGVSMRQSSGHSQDTSNHQQNDSPSTPTGFSGHQVQGSLGLSQGVSRSNSYPGGSLSQLSMPLGSPLPPTPSQHSSPALGQSGSGGSRLPPPPPLPPAYRPQRVRSEMLASPASESDISPRLARPGEEQVRQGVQEASGGERGEELGSAQQDGEAAYSGGCTSSGPSEGANGGDQGPAGGVPGYASNAPVYVNQVNQDQLYRMNAGVRPGPGAQFPYGAAGMQAGVRGRPFGGHFSSHAQYQGPPMNPPGNQGPVQMLAFRPGGPTHSSWRPA